MTHTVPGILLVIGGTILGALGKLDQTSIIAVYSIAGGSHVAGAGVGALRKNESNTTST